jgi:hypothetical protein
LGQKPKTPMPKKWIILLTIVVVVAIVAILLATYKPPDLSMTVKEVRRTGDDEINLTLTFTTKDVNVTDQYRLKVVARRTLEETETKVTVLETPLQPIPPESTEDQAFVITGISGYTDMNIQVLEGNKQVIFRTQKIPITVT